MRNSLDRFLMRIMPFIGLGIFLALLALGLVVFSYLLVIGAAVGLVLFAFFWIYRKLTGHKKIVPASSSARQGRIIDHDKH